MTDEEADALDELWTRTTPEIDTGKPGFLTRKSSVSHHSPSEIIGELVRKEMAVG